MFDVYGDESVVNNAVVYAVAVVSGPLVREVETTLQLIKAKYGGLGNPELHCRKLFAGDRRKRTPWAHLEPSQIFALCSEIAFEMRRAGLVSRVGFIDKKGVADMMHFGGQLPKTPVSEKQLVAFAYVAALAGLERHPGLDKVRLWIDPDRTRIEWGGKQRRASNIPMTFDDPVKGPGTELKPQPMPKQKPCLLELADLVAYISANTLSAQARQDKDRFQRIYQLVGPELRPFEFHPQTFANGSITDCTF